jgi:thymidylate kinase
MQVIFEGPDGAGKTSMSEKVAEILKAKRIKAVVLHDDKLTKDTAFEELRDMQQSSEITIRDRWYYPSDTIYNPVVADKPSAFSVADRTVIQHALYMVGTLVIVVIADVSVLIERVGARGDDYIQSKHIPDIYHGYQDFVEHVALPYEIIDTSDITIIEATELAVQMIEKFYYERFGVAYADRNDSTN